MKGAGGQAAGKGAIIAQALVTAATTGRARRRLSPNGRTHALDITSLETIPLTRTPLSPRVGQESAEAAVLEAIDSRIGRR